MIEPFAGFYRNKKVLVTGHTGFKGSWLSLWLHQLGAEVAGFSAYLPSKPCNFEILNLQKIINHHTGDIRNYSDISSLFETFRPQIVFHLAAQPLVRHSYNEPKLTFDTNLGGTVNILECIRHYEFIDSAVLITSDKCYKNVEWVWGYRETDPLGGDDPYSASKGCAEIAIQSYSKSYFNQANTPWVASTRAGNVIGGGDWADDRIVPDCVKAWSEGRELLIRNPQSTRPWQHVLEPLSGYLLLGYLLSQRKPEACGAFNFGPGNEVIQPVINLIKEFQKYWGSNKLKEIDTKPDKKESSLLKLSCDKALAHLQWKPVLNFHETIALTAEWYKNFYEQQTNMLEFTYNQISKYIQLAQERNIEWSKNSK
jgi:CDP-glucose 4,6-dehydratase